MPGRIHSREFKLAACQQVISGQKRPSQVVASTHCPKVS